MSPVRNPPRGASPLPREPPVAKEPSITGDQFDEEANDSDRNRNADEQLGWMPRVPLVVAGRRVRRVCPDLRAGLPARLPAGDGMRPMRDPRPPAGPGRLQPGDGPVNPPVIAR